MSEPQPAEITQLLGAMRAGDEKAADTVVNLAYDELKIIAHRQLNRLPSGGTLNTTAVVHEAFLKLNGSDTSEYADRMHFFAVAARAMRQILIDYARQERALKRGGDRARVTLDRMQVPARDKAQDLLAIGEALERLSEIDPRLTQVVECRFFGGLTEAETAQALSITERTVRRDWVKAKAWLYRQLRDD